MLHLEVTIQTHTSDRHIPLLLLVEDNDTTGEVMRSMWVPVVLLNYPHALYQQNAHFDRFGNIMIPVGPVYS